MTPEVREAAERLRINNYPDSHDTPDGYVSELREADLWLIATAYLSQPQRDMTPIESTSSDEITDADRFDKLLNIVARHGDLLGNTGSGTRGECLAAIDRLILQERGKESNAKDSLCPKEVL